MSESDLKKRLERLRGTPFPFPQPDKRIKKRERRYRGPPPEVVETKQPTVPSPKPERIKKREERAQTSPRPISEQERRVAVTPIIIDEPEKVREKEARFKPRIKTSQELIGLAQAQKAKSQAQDVTINIRTRQTNRFKSDIQKQIDKTKTMADKVLANEDKYTSESIERFKSDLETFNRQADKALKHADKVVEDLSRTKIITKKDLQKIDAYIRRIQETPERERLAVRETETPILEAIDKLQKSGLIKQTKTGSYTLEKPVEKLTSEERRILEHMGFTLPVLGKTESDRYKSRIESTTNWLASLINEDLADKKQAEKILEELKPVYESTVIYGKDPVKELLKRVDTKLSELEKEAKYGEYKGYTLFGLKKYPKEIVEARVSHIALSTAVGAAKASPFVALGTVGGPLVSGLIGASMIATIANPKNRDMLKRYAREHPEQFLAELSGALVLGWSVGQVKTLYNKYKNDIPDAYTQQFEMQLAADTPDFVSVRTEDLHPWFEEVVFTKFVSGLSPKDALQFAKSADAVLYWGSGDEYGRPMSIFDLTQVHPELSDPVAIYLPNVRRLVPKYAELISKVPGEKNTYIMPAAMAAILLAAQQGYITEEDIQRIIKNVELQNAEIKLDKLKLEIPWDDEFLSELTLPDLVSIVDALPTTITTPIIEPIITPDTETMLDVPTIEIPGLPKIERPEEPLPPETPKIGLPKFDKVKMRKFRAKLFHGPKSKYNVEFHYRRNDKQSVTVEARSYPEALSKAQRIRRITQELPNMVDMRRVK